MQDQIGFSARCPTCKNEVSQGSHNPEEIRRLLRGDRMNFYCGLCDHKWLPSSQELANVNSLLSEPIIHGGSAMDSLETYKSQTQNAMRRFLGHGLSFLNCIAALDTARVVANSKIPPEQLPALRAMVLTNNERVMKEMEKRERHRIRQHEHSELQPEIAPLVRRVQSPPSFSKDPRSRTGMH